MCVIIYPLRTSHCPLNHLAFRWLVSQQKKWKIRRKEDRNVFISVCSTTEVYLCEMCETEIRKCSITFIVIIAVFPEDPSKCQIFRAGIVSFINTVFSCNESKIPLRKKLYRAGRWIKHNGSSRIFPVRRVCRMNGCAPKTVIRIVWSSWRGKSWKELSLATDGPNDRFFQSYPHHDDHTTTILLLDSNHLLC